MDIFAKVLHVASRDPFTTSDGRTLYATDVTLSVPECRMSQIGQVFLRGRLCVCTLFSESADTSAPEMGTFVCADVSLNASYSSEKALYFNRITLNRWVCLNTVNWQWL